MEINHRAYIQGLQPSRHSEHFIFYYGLMCKISKLDVEKILKEKKIDVCRARFFVGLRSDETNGFRGNFHNTLPKEPGTQRT